MQDLCPYYLKGNCTYQTKDFRCKKCECEGDAFSCVDMRDKVVMVGLVANKPTGTNAKDNMLFHETDSGLWKRYSDVLGLWAMVNPKFLEGVLFWIN